MPDIRHRVGIGVPRARVYEALTTVDGLAGWWTDQVAGDPAEGGEVAFFFGRPAPSAVMAVTEARPARVTWRCDKGPDEWVETTVDFQLDEADGETVVLFTHAKWREPVAFLHHCSTRWAYFLISLKLLLERGEGTPYPRDLKLSRWD